MRHLPRSLDLQRLMIARVTPAEVAARRADFKKYAKPAFLQYLATNDMGALLDMEISMDGIASMQRGDLPRGPNGEQLDCTIDHILSLHLGGTNDFSNLMLIPMHINAMKNELERGQSDEHTITTIVPAGNKHVPYIDGGFQRAKRVEAA